MQLIKGFLAGFIALLLLLAGVLLAVNNQQQIAVDLVFIQLPQASVARWLLLSFLAGVLVSFAVGSVALLMMKARLRQARRTARHCERELDKLRTQHINQSN